MYICVYIFNLSPPGLWTFTIHGGRLRVPIDAGDLVGLAENAVV